LILPWVSFIVECGCEFDDKKDCKQESTCDNEYKNKEAIEPRG